MLNLPLHNLLVRKELSIYAGTPCAICGHRISLADLESGGAVYVGRDATFEGNSAHGPCWSGFLRVARYAHRQGELLNLIAEEGKGNG